MVTVAELVDHYDHFASRVLQDAVAEASRQYWLRRAADFDAVGNPACDEVAKACRAKASLALIEGAR